MEWEYFSKRRRISLEKFLAGITTLEEAEKFFAGRPVNAPANLAEFFAKRKKAEVKVATPVVSADKPVPAFKPKPKKKKTPKYEQKQSKSK